MRITCICINIICDCICSVIVNIVCLLENCTLLQFIGVMVQ